MSSTTKYIFAGLAVVAALGVAVVLFLGLGYLGFSNTANRYEVAIPATYDNNRNVYDNGWKAIMEEAQIPTKYKNDLKEVYQAAITGRYGANGSQAVMQFIKEQNPTLDPAIYTQVQRKIEGFHNDFQASQTNLIAQKQSYNEFLHATTEGRFYNMIGGYPHIPLSKYDIVTSDKTETDFDTKRADALKIQ